MILKTCRVLSTGMSQSYRGTLLFKTKTSRFILARPGFITVEIMEEIKKYSWMRCSDQG